MSPLRWLLVAAAASFTVGCARASLSPSEELVARLEAVAPVADDVELRGSFPERKDMASDVRLITPAVERVGTGQQSVVRRDTVASSGAVAAWLEEWRIGTSQGGRLELETREVLVCDDRVIQAGRYRRSAPRGSRVVAEAQQFTASWSRAPGGARLDTLWLDPAGREARPRAMAPDCPSVPRLRNQLQEASRRWALVLGAGVYASTEAEEAEAAFRDAGWIPNCATINFGCQGVAGRPPQASLDVHYRLTPRWRLMAPVTFHLPFPVRGAKPSGIKTELRYHGFTLGALAGFDWSRLTVAAGPAVAYRAWTWRDGAAELAQPTEVVASGTEVTPGFALQVAARRPVGGSWFLDLAAGYRHFSPIESPTHDGVSVRGDPSEAGLRVGMGFAW